MKTKIIEEMLIGKDRVLGHPKMKRYGPKAREFREFDETYAAHFGEEKFKEELLKWYDYSRGAPDHMDRARAADTARSMVRHTLISEAKEKLQELERAHLAHPGSNETIKYVSPLESSEVGLDKVQVTLSTANSLEKIVLITKEEEPVPFLTGIYVSSETDAFRSYIVSLPSTVKDSEVPAHYLIREEILKSFPDLKEHIPRYQDSPTLLAGNEDPRSPYITGGWLRKEGDTIVIYGEGYPFGGDKHKQVANELARHGIEARVEEN